jgi:hypothetical protein
VPGAIFLFELLLRCSYSIALSSRIMTDVISFILNAVILNGVEAHGVEAHGMRARHLGKHTVHQPGPGKTTNTFTMGSNREHHHLT